MPTIKGNNSNNKLIGESDVFGVTNYIYGYGGNDTLTGGFQADNYIWGGTGNDIIDGGTGLNRLYGEDGDDTITAGWSNADSEAYGGAGNDRLIAGDSGVYLDGGTGVDVMDGGAGADIYIVDNAKDQIIEDWVPEYDNQANPTDTVRASASYTLGAEARIELFETTKSSGTAAINLTGNSVSQTIKGNAGANTLDGKSGNDTLVGGLGADKLIGGIGTDTASYEAFVAGLVANLTTPSANTGEAAGDTFSSVENLTGSRFDDRLYGDGANNRLVGGSGNDYLSSIAGQDVIKGESGNDKLNGGAGNDILVGGSGNDVFVFTSALGSTNVDRITDFNVPYDSVHLDNAVFTKLTPTGGLAALAFAANATGSATDKFDRIIYETDTGKLFYDADGSGSGKAIQFATLSTGLSLTAADFLVF
ncbi:calcium-binding protein [Sinorhizobium fredii]|uniref:calcium-binding protein n=1 Tax=Rhizobium fredii TaxID=380 RepID=UPI000686A4A9|nr:calcium-binding protein [Sinorhizobium fredii]